MVHNRHRTLTTVLVFTVHFLFTHLGCTDELLFAWCQYVSFSVDNFEWDICHRLDILLHSYHSTLNILTYSMCSLVVSVLDSPAVVPRSNPGSGSALLMSEKSQAVYYISSCHMLIDKAFFSDKPNGHWFEADWLHCKRDALSSIGIGIVVVY